MLVVEGFLLAGLCVALIAFVAEYVDSTLGMGYGTLLTPLLLLMGYEPMQVVPAVLLSELFTGLLAGLAHHRSGNVDFGLKWIGLPRTVARMRQLGLVESLRRGIPRALKIALLIASCSIIGAVLAVFVAVNISKFYLKLYIGAMVLAMGVYILLRRNKQGLFSWKKVTSLGLVASFNKGISGGGYGPIVTGGQIISGVEGKNAIATTSLAEGLTCAVGFTAYLAVRGVQDWTLFPYLCVGAVLSVPFSVRTVKWVSTRKLTLVIGVFTVVLGSLTLLKAVL